LKALVTDNKEHLSQVTNNVTATANRQITTNDVVTSETKSFHMSIAAHECFQTCSMSPK